MQQEPKALRVAILGTGPDSLVAANHILDCHANARVVLLESSSCLGGKWLQGPSQPGVAGALFAVPSHAPGRGRANPALFLALPTDMGTSEAGSGGPSVPTTSGSPSQQLREFAARAGLLGRVRFSCALQRAKYTTMNQEWRLSFQDTLTGKSGQLCADLLVLTRSQVAVPRKPPPLPGQALYDGRVIHVPSGGHMPKGELQKLVGQHVVVLAVPPPHPRAGFQGADKGEARPGPEGSQHGHAAGGGHGKEARDVLGWRAPSATSAQSPPLLALQLCRLIAAVVGPEGSTTLVLNDTPGRNNSGSVVSSGSSGIALHQHEGPHSPKAGARPGPGRTGLGPFLASCLGACVTSEPLPSPTERTPTATTTTSGRIKSRLSKLRSGRSSKSVRTTSAKSIISELGRLGSALSSSLASSRTKSAVSLEEAPWRNEMAACGVRVVAGSVAALHGSFVTLSDSTDLLADVVVVSPAPAPLPTACEGALSFDLDLPFLDTRSRMSTHGGGGGGGATLDGAGGTTFRHSGSLRSLESSACSEHSAADPAVAAVADFAEFGVLGRLHRGVLATGSHAPNLAVLGEARASDHCPVTAELQARWLMSCLAFGPHGEAVLRQPTLMEGAHDTEALRRLGMGGALGGRRGRPLASRPLAAYQRLLLKDLGVRAPSGRPVAATLGVGRAFMALLGRRTTPGSRPLSAADASRLLGVTPLPVSAAALDWAAAAAAAAAGADHDPGYTPRGVAPLLGAASRRLTELEAALGQDASPGTCTNNTAGNLTPTDRYARPSSGYADGPRRISIGGHGDGSPSGTLLQRCSRGRLTPSSSLCRAMASSPGRMDHLQASSSMRRTSSAGVGGSLGSTPPPPPTLGRLAPSYSARFGSSVHASAPGPGGPGPGPSQAHRRLGPSNSMRVTAMPRSPMGQPPGGMQQPFARGGLTPTASMRRNGSNGNGGRMPPPGRLTHTGSMHLTRQGSMRLADASDDPEGAPRSPSRDVYAGHNMPPRRSTTGGDGMGGGMGMGMGSGVPPSVMASAAAAAAFVRKSQSSAGRRSGNLPRTSSSGRNLNLANIQNMGLGTVDDILFAAAFGTSSPHRTSQRGTPSGHSGGPPSSHGAASPYGNGSYGNQLYGSGPSGGNAVPLPYGSGHYAVRTDGGRSSNAFERTWSGARSGPVLARVMSGRDRQNSATSEGVRSVDNVDSPWDVPSIHLPPTAPVYVPCPSASPRPSGELYSICEQTPHPGTDIPLGDDPDGSNEALPSLNAGTEPFDRDRDRDRYYQDRDRDRDRSAAQQPAASASRSGRGGGGLAGTSIPFSRLPLFDAAVAALGRQPVSPRDGQGQGQAGGSGSGSGSGSGPAVGIGLRASGLLRLDRAMTSAPQRCSRLGVTGPAAGLGSSRGGAGGGNGGGGMPQRRTTSSGSAQGLRPSRRSEPGIGSGSSGGGSSGGGMLAALLAPLRLGGGGSSRHSAATTTDQEFEFSCSPAGSRGMSPLASYHASGASAGPFPGSGAASPTPAMLSKCRSFGTPEAAAAAAALSTSPHQLLAAAGRSESLGRRQARSNNLLLAAANASTRKQALAAAAAARAAANAAVTAAAAAAYGSTPTHSPPLGQRPLPPAPALPNLHRLPTSVSTSPFSSSAGYASASAAGGGDYGGAGWSGGGVRTTAITVAQAAASRASPLAPRTPYAAASAPAGELDDLDLPGLPLEPLPLRGPRRPSRRAEGSASGELLPRADTEPQPCVQPDRSVTASVSASVSVDGGCGGCAMSALQPGLTDWASAPVALTPEDEMDDAASCESEVNLRLDLDLQLGLASPHADAWNRHGEEPESPRLLMPPTGRFVAVGSGASSGGASRNSNTNTGSNKLQLQQPQQLQQPDQQQHAMLFDLGSPTDRGLSVRGLVTSQQRLSLLTNTPTQNREATAAHSPKAVVSLVLDD
ncbi:hypothetical protein HYH03_004521 [Edaphochlamys debaryana]|uniref:Uncharacterized protein n=1 Tax=Edaphochlamys debaryana TaxID=47281 RepID=A0A835Y9B1_9CHLO|nr:hypothetical protein HYH03_004521 [Edaphochlamys debaryana]|eukprot:KAG2497362.1 hypothetical protein HYH03_004521 [Edaphochlamys debaryana]